MIGTINHPASGSIIVNGKDLSNCSDNQSSEPRKHSMGFIFQHCNLIPVLTALENVMLPLPIRDVSPSITRRKAMTQLEAVGLAAVASQRPDQMSDGQQQQVAVARAIITEPHLIMADESTASLDSTTARHLIP